MVTKRQCSFCSTEIEPGTGTMFVKRDGTVYQFCSSSCRKQQLGLGRTGHRLKWTRAYALRKAAERSSAERGAAQARATPRPAASPAPTAPPTPAVPPAGAGGTESAIPVEARREHPPTAKPRAKPASTGRKTSSGSAGTKPTAKKSTKESAKAEADRPAERPASDEA